MGHTNQQFKDQELKLASNVTDTISPKLINPQPFHQTT